MSVTPGAGGRRLVVLAVPLALAGPADRRGPLPRGPAAAGQAAAVPGADRRAQRADLPVRGDAVPHRTDVGPAADRRRAVPAEPRAGPRRRRERPRVDRPGARGLRRQPRHLHGRLPGQAPQQGPARRAGAGLDAGRPGGPADPERPHPAAARPPQGHRAARRLRLPHRHPRALRERRPRRRPHHRAHRRLPRAGLVAGGQRAGGAAGVPHLHVGLQRLLGDPSGPGRAAEPAPVGGRARTSRTGSSRPSASCTPTW